MTNETTITNTDPRHPAMIYRGDGQAVEFVCHLAPLAAITLPGDGYWADTGRVSFDELDAAVARAFERTKLRPMISAGARVLRRALEASRGHNRGSTIWQAQKRNEHLKRSLVDFAEAIANGATIRAAGVVIGVNHQRASVLFKRMRDELGWQAQ